MSQTLVTKQSNKCYVIKKTTLFHCFVIWKVKILHLKFLLVNSHLLALNHVFLFFLLIISSIFIKLISYSLPVYSPSVSMFCEYNCVFQHQLNTKYKTVRNVCEARVQLCKLVCVFVCPFVWISNCLKSVNTYADSVVLSPLQKLHFIYTSVTCLCANVCVEVCTCGIWNRDLNSFPN